MPVISVSATVETQLGERVVVVGSVGALGAWEPSKGVDIFTDERAYPVWSGDLRLSQDEFVTLQKGTLEFKLVVLRPNGAFFWEPGANRRATVRVLDCIDFVSLKMRFGETTHTQVDVQAGTVQTCDSLAQQDDEHSTFALKENDTSKQCDLVSPSTSAESMAASPPHALSRTCFSPNIKSSKGLKLRPGVHRVKKFGGFACEDAYCLGSDVMGVADGVSSMSEFARYGVDAAAFAAQLMDLAQQAAHDYDTLAAVDERASARAAAAIAAAEAKVTAYGASTMTVLTMSGSTAGVANLGDSGFMLLRPKPWGMEIIQRSVEQQHCWNCPYQLTRIPRSLSEKLRFVKLDTAQDCQRYDVVVEEGDLLVLYTDGLSDNLFSAEIVNLINQAVADDATSTPPEKIAEALVSAAQDRSMDATAETPFSKEAQRQRRNYFGGKVDDITVVAAWVAP